MKQRSFRVNHTGELSDMSGHGSGSTSSGRRPKRTNSGPSKRNTNSAKDEGMGFESDDSEVLIEVSRPSKPAGSKKNTAKRRGSGRNNQRSAGTRSGKKEGSNHKSKSRGNSPVPTLKAEDSSASDIDKGSGRGRRNSDSFDDEEVGQRSSRVSSLGSRPPASKNQLKPLSTRVSTSRPMSTRSASVRINRPSATSDAIRPHSSRGRPTRPSTSRGGKMINSGHNRKEKIPDDKNGALVPYYPENEEGSEASGESFHEGGELIEYQGEEVVEYDYDAGKLRPPPKMKLQREDSELGEFPDDAWWQKCLRHFRILPPHPQEEKIKKELRILIWSTLILDALVGVVSIATFGSVTECCGLAVMASIPGIDWNLFMNVISYLYLIGIFVEIHPVVREGPIPWNLINPVFGFMIGFAVFVDDSKAEAICIWIMEMGSVVMEVLTYRRLRVIHHRKLERLEKLQEEIPGEKGRGYKKTVLLRERRETRLIVASSQKKLQYHFVGVAVNGVLVVVSLLMIIFVARGGGLCMVKGDGLDIFAPDQRARCFKCPGDGRCEVCTESGGIDQCYYPYF
eukprot:scaffold8288_cov129-Cylindrotheca_fusiformis.AAC.3